MRTPDPRWVTLTFLWVSPAVAFQRAPARSPTRLAADLLYSGDVCLQRRLTAYPACSHCVISGSAEARRHAALRRVPEPNYKSGVRSRESNGEGRCLTCMASIASLTTMSGFTLAVNCPPLGSPAPSCRMLSCLFLPFFVSPLIGSDLNRLTVG